MPHPDEPYYCSEQIQIPPALPDILKQYTKAAIRTQPTDLILWSAKYESRLDLKKFKIKFILFHFLDRYFRCLAKGEIPPVKERLEIPVATQKTDSGLTIGLIKTLHKQVIV